MESYLKKAGLLQAAVLYRMNDLAGQGILLTDTQLIILGWNKWLEDHTGHKAEKIIGTSLLELYPSLIERGLLRQYEWALEGQVRVLSQRLHGFVLPMRPVSEAGGFEQMQQSVRISPLSEAGAVVGTVTVIDDVTERVAREAELQEQIEFRSKLLASEQAAREEAERANALKDEFLATISHELRTPLNAIMGWSHMLRSRKLDEKTTDRAIDSIHRNAQAQNTLIGDLLDVSRIISGKLTLEPRPLDLLPIIEESLDAIRPAAEAKQISLSSFIDRDVTPILADEDRLQQIVWNLLTNAVKFTPNGGQVDVRLEQVGCQLQITVSDSGIGISSDFLPHVFDRFRQADSASTRAQGGLGLGLSIVHHLVELHGGKVRAESPGPGKGSSFTVCLPSIQKSETVDHPVHMHEELESCPALKDLIVLVVDDESDSCELLKTLLERYGSRVETAGSAAEAMEVLKRTRPDILISDIGMPAEDGYSLIAKVRALPTEQGGQIPAAALSAYAAATDRQRIIRSGFQVHLAKPIQPIPFLLAIAGLAAGRNQVTDSTQASEMQA